MGESGKGYTTDNPPLAGPPVNTPNTAGKGPFDARCGHWSAHATNEIVALKVGAAARRTSRNPG
jgi:hypothetical protein